MEGAGGGLDRAGDGEGVVVEWCWVVAEWFRPLSRWQSTSSMPDLGVLIMNKNPQIPTLTLYFCNLVATAVLFTLRSNSLQPACQNK